jgi:pyocin large subunit-like protein
VGSSYINHFIQPDSLIPDPSNPQAWNRYSYVGNNPVNFNDPTGHQKEKNLTGYQRERQNRLKMMGENIRLDKKYQHP